MRTACAFGVKAILFPKDRNCQLTAGVIKASSGAIYNLDLIRVVNVGQACEQPKAGYWVYTTDVNNGDPITTATPNSPTVLVVGNEVRRFNTSSKISGWVFAYPHALAVFDP